MRILVIGGTGKVGGHLVPNLVCRGATVRVFTRDASRAAGLINGIEAVEGDLVRHPDAAATAFAGQDAVFMLNRPTAEEQVEGLLAVELARTTGVRRFVFQSVHAAERMAHVPHVASKLAIERGLQASGMEWTLLRPNYFFQNDLLAKAAFERDLYVQPIGAVGVAAVDARDIADAAAVLLTDSKASGQTINLVGPEVLTAETAAAAWSKALGKPIRNVATIDGWRAAMPPQIPAWFNYDLGMMYRHLETVGMLPEANDVEALTTLLGRSPRRYRDYVAEQAAEWGLAPAS